MECTARKAYKHAKSVIFEIRIVYLISGRFLINSSKRTLRIANKASGRPKTINDVRKQIKIITR